MENASDDQGAITRRVTKRSIHPNWREDIPLYFDVGILEMDQVEFTKFIRPICLPDASSITVDKYGNDFVTLTGAALSQ